MPFKSIQTPHGQISSHEAVDPAVQKAASKSQGIIRTRPVEQIKIMLPGVRVAGLRLIEIDREKRAQRLEAWTEELGRDADMLGRAAKAPHAKDQAPPVLEEPAVILPGIMSMFAKWGLVLLDAFVEMDAKPGSDWKRTQFVFGLPSGERELSDSDASSALQWLQPVLVNMRYECFVYENWRPRDEKLGKAGGLFRELTVNLRKGKALKTNSTVEVKRLRVDGNVLRAAPLGT